MDEELIAAIVATPHDDVPRLVYADWLMQRGDPMGELIVLQCRLAAGESTPAIVARERELRVALEPRWLAPLQAIAFGGFELRRGFVEHVELFSAVARRGFGRSPEKRIPDELFTRAPLLQSLGIRGRLLHDGVPAGFARLDTLALHELGAPYDLTLDDTPELVDTLVASPYVAQLRRLDITNGRLSPEVVDRIIDIACPLDHLRLDVSYGRSSIVVDGARAIARLAGTIARRSLRSLVLVGFAVADLTPLAALGRLERIRLIRCTLREGAARELATHRPELVVVDGSSPRPSTAERRSWR
jgi:uncharacterized protein (TIGR02996 family)